MGTISGIHYQVGEPERSLTLQVVSKIKDQRELSNSTPAQDHMDHALVVTSEEEQDGKRP